MTARDVWLKILLPLGAIALVAWFLLDLAADRRRTNEILRRDAQEKARQTQEILRRLPSD